MTITDKIYGISLVLLLTTTYLLFPFSSLVPLLVLCFMSTIINLFKNLELKFNEIVGYILISTLLIFSIIREDFLFFTSEVFFLINLFFALLFFSYGSEEKIKFYFQFLTAIFIFQMFFLIIFIDMANQVNLNSKINWEEYQVFGYLERFFFLLLGKSLFAINSNEVGFFAALGLICFHRLDKKLFFQKNKKIIIALTILLILSFSRSALLLVAIYFLFNLKFRSILLIFAISFMILFQFDFIDYSISRLQGFESNQERFNLAAAAIREVSINSFFGSSLKSYYGLESIGPHNEFLYSLMRGGLFWLIFSLFSVFLILNFNILAILILLYIWLFTHNFFNSAIYLVSLLAASKLK